MQKWEYLYVETMLTTVVNVNGQRVAQERKGKYGSEFDGEHIYQLTLRSEADRLRLT
jgi:hypothetical protein